MQRRRLLRSAFQVAVGAVFALHVLSVSAQTTVSGLESSARRALEQLVARVPAAKALSKDAVAVLVFPRVTRVGFVFGAQYGEGVLFRDGKPAGYFRQYGGSWGLQAGAKQFGYAMFFMNEASVGALTNTRGFEIGVGPTVVIVDQGMSTSLTTMNARSDILAFIFSQRGLMAGLGLQGNRITQVSR